LNCSLRYKEGCQRKPPVLSPKDLEAAEKEEERADRVSISRVRSHLDGEPDYASTNQTSDSEDTVSLVIVNAHPRPDSS
jgi:hypothetical protein